MAIDITTVGASGVHTLKSRNVNSEESYIYFKNDDLPESVVDQKSYIYSDGIGSITGLTSGSLFYASVEGTNILKFLDSLDAQLTITGSLAGGIFINDPVIVDSEININVSTPSNQAVKYYTTGAPLTGLVSGNTYFLKNIEIDFTGKQSLYDMTGDTHTFTTCNQTGRVGPDQLDIQGGYSTPWHNTPERYLREGSFVGYQDWTVPISGFYDFEVAGASGYEGTGSGVAGKGAIVKGRLLLTKGEIITVAVGQVGEAPQSGTIYGGSGGGSFVVRKQGTEPLLIAGGGSADANTVNGNNGQTTTRGGAGAFALPGGENGFGGTAEDGKSAGGGGFFSSGQDSNVNEKGGGAFVNGLTSSDNGARTGGNGGFGGGASSDAQSIGQSGGGGGYSGGAGSRTNAENIAGGGGGSFISRVATSVATSDGEYEESSIFNGQAITDLNTYNTGEGEVTVTLVSSFTSGNTVHPSAQDAEDNTNAISVSPAGNSFHAFVPISYDIQNEKIHFTSPHGFEDGESIGFNLSVTSPDINQSATYYVELINDFTIGLSYSPAVNFTTPTVKSSTNTIRKIVVNLELNSINLPSHGFALNQPVRYSSGGGTEIQAAVPLDNNATYYIAEVIDQNNIKLKASINAPNPIDFTAEGTGTNHSFIFLTVNTSEDSLYIPNHGLISGQTISYTTNGGSVVGGLTEGETYYIEASDASTIKLYDTPTLSQPIEPGGSPVSPVDLTSEGTGTHSLVIAAIDFETETITIPEHGFLQGELVEYDARGQTEISGLQTNETYYIIFVNGNNIKLAETAQDAEAGIAIDLGDSPTGVGRHSLTSLRQTPDGIYTITAVPTDTTFEVEARGQVPILEKIFNPRSTIAVDVDSFFLPSHGFVTGTKIFYEEGALATPIGGLTDSTDYYVVVINQDYFRLSTSLENALSGTTIELADFGSGGAHSLKSSQLNGRIVGSGNVSVTAGSVLVDGTGTSFAKILKVGDPFILYPENETEILTFSDTNVNISNNRIEIAHNFTAGDLVKFDNGGGSTPSGITNQYYYYVGVINATAIQLFTSYDAAIALTGAQNFTQSGDGDNMTLTNTIPSGPIVRRITAVGSDFQVTVDRPYSSEYNEVAYAYPTFMYVRPSGYALHRPFDGGVEMSTGSQNWFGQIIRQTRKYFRYQSGKGIQTSFAINFKPSIDIENMERFSASQVRVTTRRPHNLKEGLIIQVAESQDSTGETSTLYNGQFTVVAIDDLLTFRVTKAVPEGVESRAYGFPQFHVTSWSNGALRAGMFDFQNGMFFEFDGQKIYAVRRSSTQQTAGTVSALRGSERIFGQNTRFVGQFVEGDYVVLRGQTYRVINIQNDTTMSVRPEYRGSTGVEITFDPQTQIDLLEDKFTIVRHGLSQNLPVVYNSIDGSPLGGLINGRTYYADIIDSNSFKLFATPSAASNVNISNLGTTNIHSFIPAQSGIIVTKTVDTRVPQESWSIDVCDGEGPSGYDLDLSRIQMAYIDYSWYGAGKVRFGFKTNDGLVRYVHEFKHNNVLFESYFRSGNLPARYEVTTFEDPTYVPSLFHWGTSVIMDGQFDDDRGYLFTAGSQTLNISGTTTKSFASEGINTTTDLITSLTHGFKTGDIVEFQSIAADGLVGINGQNPSISAAGSQEEDKLTNNAKYKIFVNSPDRIHLTPENATITIGGTFSRSASTVTVVTATDHDIPSASNNVGIYGIYDTNGDPIANLPEFYVGPVTVTNATTFTFTVAGSETVESTVIPGAAISEVLDFITQGNVQYTFFLYPNGSLNNTTGPNYQPLISLRLSPSADSGLTGRLGDKDIINRMQVRMQEIGVSSDELVEVKLILNGRLNNLGFTPIDQPSLIELVEHTPQDTISGGVQIYNFQAEAGSTSILDLDKLFELSNSILGGDNVFPDGPDILTVAVSRLTGNDTRTTAKLSWLEAQA